MLKQPCKQRAQKGQAMAEYVIAAVFLAIVVWYAMVGGSVTLSGKGGLWETDPNHKGTGALLDAHIAGEKPMPGLIQALHRKQETFVDTIYEP